MAKPDRSTDHTEAGKRFCAKDALQHIHAPDNLCAIRSGFRPNSRISVGSCSELDQVIEERPISFHNSGVPPRMGGLKPNQTALAGTERTPLSLPVDTPSSRVSL